VFAKQVFAKQLFAKQLFASRSVVSQPPTATSTPTTSRRLRADSEPTRGAPAARSLALALAT
jgi:hypothetical protein